MGRGSFFDSTLRGLARSFSGQSTRSARSRHRGETFSRSTRGDKCTPQTLKKAYASARDGNGLVHHIPFVRAFPGGSAAARDISRLISAQAPLVASCVRLALRCSGCLGSDQGVFPRSCLCSGSGRSVLLWRECAVLCCCGGLFWGRSFSRTAAARLAPCALEWRLMISRRFAARDDGLRLAFSRAYSIGCCVAMCARSPAAW